ncbi:GNAT family N-acetyltransferase [Saccharibacillus qingshengii]|uniref:GNAT family N-acetyltransferase n=1 Tax=Saccharibacillus qingshengii TaxID=1763540 RepID=UPI001FE9D0EE|nr:GNAT family N-acetyltransferase [Saccharibacillus qingshengii]
MDRNQAEDHEKIAYEPQPDRLDKELLKCGDPLEWRIETYLHEAQWWTAGEEDTVTAAVGFLRVGAEEAEIMNAASVHWDNGSDARFVRLLQKVCGELRRSGVRRLTAYTGNWETALLQAYQRCGFRIASVEPDYYVGCWPRGEQTEGMPRVDRLMLEALEGSAGSPSVVHGIQSGLQTQVRRVELKDSRKLLAMKKQLDRETTSMLYEPGERRMTEGDQLEQIRSLLRSSNSLMLVAENEGEVVGYLEATGGKVRRNQHTVYVVIGILESYTGQGLGRRLFEELFDWAGRRHILRAELTVQAPNQRAYRLYRSIGFKLEGIMRGALIIEGEPVDLYQMGLDLRTIRRSGVDK